MRVMLRRLASSSVAICAALVLGTGVAQAQPADGAAPVEGNTTGPYCSTLVGKAAVGEVSPVLHRTCSDVSADKADAQLLQWRAQYRSSAWLAPQADAVVVMHWYEHAHFGGRHDRIWGDGGPCDSAGYTLDPTTFWPWNYDWSRNLSSAFGQSYCSKAEFINLAKNDKLVAYGMDQHGIADLGSFNDNVGLIRTSRG
ncbi:hypothetical protein GCM10012275_46680 [Longimycelium tulufanense]|uniref:Secreted protein n=1 Tax=Longimycelium tulufanense TaxID=907463 RepID=A0A8J3CI91_9PSEU|nr:hypothetical protein [Longimycelium tulufanense]GGM70893.1 hypothetical protein GCM10012275_46680 [Longimycelium tulufanense]